MVETNNITNKKLIKNKGEKSVVGLDMSMSKFLVSSNEEDNTIIKYNRNYRLEEKRLKKLNRRISRKEKGSKNRYKARIRYATLCEKIANRRKDFNIKTALYFARKYDVIVIEDLNMQAMSKTLHLGKSVMDLGWGTFRNWLLIKCEEYDSELVISDKWYASSKICNHCGYKNKELKLSDRKWICPCCGESIDRDYNASCNLRDYYIKNKNTVGTTGIHACGDNTSTNSLEAVGKCHR